LHNLFEVEEYSRILPRVASELATLGFVAESFQDSGGGFEVTVGTWRFTRERSLSNRYAKSGFLTVYFCATG
jgi:hypothetical protein